MKTFRELITNEKATNAFEREHMDAIKGVNFNKTSTWGRNAGGVNFYPWSGERAWSGMYTDMGNRTDHYIHGQYILQLFISVDRKMVISELCKEENKSLTYLSSKTFSIKEWNTLTVSNNRTACVINAIDNKPYAKITKIEKTSFNSQRGPQFGRFGIITFDNGSTAGIYASSTEESVALKKSALDSAMEKYKIFNADDKFEAAFPDLLKDNHIRKELAKIKPKKLASDSSSIPSSAHVSGTQTVTVYEYDVKNLLKAYGDEAVRAAAREFLVKNPYQQSLVLDKNKIYFTNRSEQWYD